MERRSILKGMTASIFCSTLPMDALSKGLKNNIVLYKENLDINIKYKENLKLPIHNDKRWFSPIDRTLRRELKSRNLNYWFDTTSYKQLVNIKISYENGFFEFFIPRERLTSSSARIFALWITVPALLVISIAMIFLKN